MLTSAEEEAGVAVDSTEEEMENPDDTSLETNEESIPPPKEEITDLSDASRKDLSEEYDDETESLLPYSKLVSQVDTMQQRILEFEAMQQRFSEFEAMQQRFLEFEAMQRRLSDVESAQREIFDLEQMRSNDPPGRYERFKDDKSILDDEQDNTPASTESTNKDDHEWAGEMQCDIFSLQMISKPRSLSWLVGLSTFYFQMMLITLILADQIEQSENSSLFNVPYTVDVQITIAQIMSIFFSILTQDDVLTAIESLTMLSRRSEWERIIPEGIEHAGWTFQILIPNLCKLVQGIMVLFVSLVVIAQSDDIIDLLQDFSALMVVSQLDNLMFFFAKSGFLGRHLKMQTVKVEKTDLGGHVSLGYFLRPLVLISIASIMIGAWVVLVIQQSNGSIFEARYPDCIGVDHVVAKEHFGDGICYGGTLNTIGCHFEGEDCINFNIEYPLCRGDGLVNVQEELSNGVCNMTFSTPGCAFDNYACCNKSVVDSETFGDGLCNGGIANTRQCYFDNKDLLDYRYKLVVVCCYGCCLFYFFTGGNLFNRAVYKSVY